MINTTAELLTVAHKHDLQLKAESIKIETSGIDFLVAFAIDEDGISWVLRVPRRFDVVEKAIYESKILNLVRDRLPIAVPEPSHAPRRTSRRTTEHLHCLPCFSDIKMLAVACGIGWKNI